MARAIDHIVFAYRDLEAAADRFRHWGFHVGALNRHPWGTENHIVQLDGVFLELVGLAKGFSPPPLIDPSYPFAGFLADFLTRNEGLAMLALRSEDAEADSQAFVAAGWGARSRLDFGRQGQRRGQKVDVAFSLAFAQPDAVSRLGFFVCQHHFPHNFWYAAAQVHPNGASGIATIAFAHPEPKKLSSFLSSFLSAEVEALPEDLRFPIQNAVIRCATLDSLSSSIGPEFIGTAAVEIHVRDRSTFWIY